MLIAHRTSNTAAGPELRNSLPSHLKEANLSYNRFRRSIKTFFVWIVGQLFYFNCTLLAYLLNALDASVPVFSTLTWWPISLSSAPDSTDYCVSVCVWIPGRRYLRCLFHMFAGLCDCMHTLFIHSFSSVQFNIHLYSASTNVSNALQ